MYIRRDERAGVIAESRRNVHLVAPLTELSTAHGRSLSYHEYSTANLGSSFHFRYDAVMKSTLVNLDDISEAAVTCPGTNEIAVFLADVRVAEPWLARLRADDDDLIFSGGQFVEHTCLDTNGHFSPFLRRALRLKAASVQLPGGASSASRQSTMTTRVFALTSVSSTATSSGHRRHRPCSPLIRWQPMQGTALNSCCGAR